MNITHFLDELSTESGNPIYLNEDGNCVFMYEKNLPIYLESSQDAETACIYTSFSKIPSSKNKIHYYKALMQSHLFGELTHNAYFGINLERTNIYLFKNLFLKDKVYKDILLDIYHFSVAYYFLKTQLSLP